MDGQRSCYSTVNTQVSNGSLKLGNAMLNVVDIRMVDQLGVRVLLYFPGLRLGKPLSNEYHSFLTHYA
jgi:hypothetical protein